MYLLNKHAFQFDRRALVWLGLSLLAMFCALFPLEVWASDTGGDLPFDAGIIMLKESITGPLAAMLSLGGIVVAGGMLIFGGDLSGFMRSMIFLVLVIAIIVGASALITSLGFTTTVVAGLDVDGALVMSPIGKLV